MWSLGCILYELMTCEVLFPYQTVQENLAKALAINRVFHFKLFPDGRRRSHLINNYGLLTINNSQSGFGTSSEVVIPLKGFSLAGSQECSKEKQALVNFIQDCLVMDPAKRLKVEDAMNHQFIKLKLGKET